ncbi:MAG TPA: DUF6036 family nucleotidyltransferase [Chitinophagaceae bacterium]|nr:DUF6036 family nucleotidyltransferase [Chitinophagaceae bacterium]
MDVFDEELLNLWKCLNENNVRYIMVGGVATNLHGYQRSTEDIDLWLEDNVKNRKNLRKALKEYGLGDFEPIERIKFLPGWTDFYLNSGMRLDIMTKMKGLEDIGFNECLQKAMVAEISTIQVPFLHINQLIQNKEAVNRPKDQLDVIYLRKILEIQEENESKSTGA